MGQDLYFYAQELERKRGPILERFVEAVQRKAKINPCERKRGCQPFQAPRGQTEVRLNLQDEPFATLLKELDRLEIK